MNVPILTTKLNIPPARSDHVVRPDLLERLTTGASSKLTLIAAPPGFGKTSLLSTWARRGSLPSAWLTLDREDNEPSRFFLYVVTALQSIAPDAGHIALAMLQSAQAVPLNSVLVSLINELSILPDHLCLILDDYHLIDTPDIHTAVTFLIDHLPQCLHIVIASRSDPPLPLSRLRVQGHLTEVRQEDLRFSMEDSAAFLNGISGLALTLQEIEVLGIRTEGWVAGLHLAALSLRSKEDPAAFIQEFSGSHRHIIDYLADEVLSQQPQDLRQFLRETSILDRFTAPLCDAVTGRNDSFSLLKTLEAANLFIIPLDEQREWYRYHHLFGDFLTAGLEAAHKNMLHKKAARWFVTESLYPEAVKHALASGDLDEAVPVIAQATPEAFNQGSLNSLSGWLNTLPENIVRQTLVLTIYKSFSLFFTGSIEDAILYAKIAEQNLPGDVGQPNLGRFLSLKAHIALCEDQLDECVGVSREALENLHEDDHVLRNLTLNVLGQVLEIRGEVAAARDIYRQAFRSGMRSGDQMGTLVVFTNLVFALNELGLRQEALSVCRGLQSWQGLALLDAGYLAYSLLSYEADELDTAIEQAQSALALLSTLNVSQGIMWGNFILARIHLARGEFEEVFRLTRKGIVDAAQSGMDSIQGTWFAAVEAQAHLQRGNLSKAAYWAETTGYTPQDTPLYWLEFPYFTYVRLLLARHQIDAARELLGNLETAVCKGGRLRKQITIHLLFALAHLDKKEIAEACTRVESALKLAAPENYRRAFLDEGPEIVQLLPKVRHAAPAFVDELIYAFQAPPQIDDSGEEPFTDALTAREQDVLRLVAKGLSNREIAEVLFVTLGTTKKHLNNIFSKLHVASRTQAIARAEELDLLK